ncbi:unnamed protein product [Lasius platythorax]|uniref:Uncharacterized protein n=1 Tax=Lasius platythorax TaxID=488582 RepID=A0AAV2NUV7_9HYME
MINSHFNMIEGTHGAAWTRDWFQYRDVERGWSAARRSSANRVHCRLQVHAVKEVALRWSALTRPVAHASGVLVEASTSRSRAAPRKSHHLLRRAISALSS